MIDDTLYDAFGQRQVSTMYTPLNQYHVVMEIDPRFAQDPEGLQHIYLRPTDGIPPCRSTRSHTNCAGHHAAGRESPGSISVRDNLV